MRLPEHHVRRELRSDPLEQRTREESVQPLPVVQHRRIPVQGHSPIAVAWPAAWLVVWLCPAICFGPSPTSPVEERMTREIALPPPAR